jgi:hypothetical protein
MFGEYPYARLVDLKDKQERKRLYSLNLKIFVMNHLKKNFQHYIALILNIIATYLYLRWYIKDEPLLEPLASLFGLIAVIIDLIYLIYVAQRIKQNRKSKKIICTIILEGKAKDFDNQKKALLVQFLATNFRMEITDINIKSISEGSIIVKVEVPKNKAGEIVMRINNHIQGNHYHRKGSKIQYRLYFDDSMPNLIKADIDAKIIFNEKGQIYEIEKSNLEKILDYLYDLFSFSKMYDTNTDFDNNELRKFYAKRKFTTNWVIRNKGEKPTFNWDLAKYYAKDASFFVVIIEVIIKSLSILINLLMH